MSAAIVLQIAVAAFALTPRVHVPTAELLAGPIKPVAVAPDGSWAAFVSMGGICDYDKDEGMGRVQVWDLRTGTLDRSFPAPGLWRDKPVVVSPDGRWLAYPGYENYKRQLRLHDFRTGARIQAFRDVGEENEPLGFSPDGKELYSATRYGTRIVVWSAADGSKLREVKTTGYDSIALAPDARHAIVQASSGNKELWDLTAGKKVADLGWLSGDGRPTFVRGGKEVALLYNYYPAPVFRPWDLATHKYRETIKVPGKAKDPREYAISDDLSAVAVLEYRGDVKVYDAGKAEPRFTFSLDVPHAEGLRFTPDGKRLIVAHHHQRAWVLDATTGKPVFALDPDYRAVRALAFSADGKALVAGVTDWRRTGGGGVGVGPEGFLLGWDTTTGELKRAARGLDHYLHALYPSPDGQKVIAITTNNGYQAEWWDLVAGKRAKLLAGESERLQSFGGSADGRKFGGVKYEYVPRPDDKLEAALRATWVWDPATGERLPDLPAILCSFRLQFTPDGERIVFHNYSGTVQAMRASSGRSGAIWKRGDSADNPHPRDAIPLPGGESFVSLYQPQQYGPQHLYLFDMGRAVKFGEVDIGVGPLAISPDGKWVAVGGQASVYGMAGKPNPVYLWRVPELGRLDEKQLATGRLSVSELPSKRVELVGHLGEVYAVAFSPDGKTLATGGRDRVIRLWDVNTGELRASLWAAAPTDPAGVPTEWAAFTPKGFHAGTARGRAALRFTKVADPAALLQPDKVKEALRGK